jgi:hypothetical protein
MVNDNINVEDLQKQLQKLEIRIKDIEEKINKNTKKTNPNNIKTNPNNIKRSLSAYQLYSKDIRLSVTEDVKNNKDNEKLNGKEISNLIMKKIGEKWTNINIKEKQKYEEKAKKLKTQLDTSNK